MRETVSSVVKIIPSMLITTSLKRSAIFHPDTREAFLLPPVRLNQREIHGEIDGPRLLITDGLHRDEFEPWRRFAVY